MDTTDALMTVVNHMSMHVMSAIFIFAMFFMLIDIITGWIKAIATKTFSSVKMREGFFHKMGIILILMVAVAIDSFIAGEFGNIGITAPIFDAACLYIIIMEVSSILENIGKINPHLENTKLMDLFAGIKDKNKEIVSEHVEADGVDVDVTVSKEE